MVLPDYNGGSIVNLMASIGDVYAWKSPYKQLRYLPSKELKGGKNIVLLLIDGLGYEYILKYGAGNKILCKDKIKAKITSVFPSSTASAATAIMTGEGAKEHGITGWYTYLKEIGAVTTLLPFKTRAGGEPLKKLGIKASEVVNCQSFFNKIKAQSYSLVNQSLKDSEYYLHSSRGAKKLYYRNITDFIGKLNSTIRKNNSKKYIYGYWPKFDSLSHDYGLNNNKTIRHFQLLDKKLNEFLGLIKNTDTKVIITADHGMVDTRMIKLADHPKLQKTLVLPLCGDHRTVFCYVHPFKKAQFENYVKNDLSDYCKLYRSEDLIKKNIWGIFKANENLLDRVGDYTLIMKDNYAIADRLPGENKASLMGNHGGLSKEEMYVPLIVI